MSRASAVLVLALLVGLVPAGCGGGVADQLAAARAQQDDGQFEDSIEPLRQVLALEPENAEGNFLLGYALVRTGRVGPAVWPLRKAAQSSEYGDKASQMLVFALLNSGNFDEARIAADAVLASKPGDAGTLRLRAQANLDGRHFDEMLKDAEKILEGDPNDVQARQLRAVALTELERWDDAEAAFQQLRDDAAKSDDAVLASRACIALAKVREKRGDQAAATKAFADCADAYPADGMVLGEVAQYYVRQQRPEQAEALWRAAVERAPDSLPFRIGLGNQLAADGNLEEAKQVLGKAADDFASPQAWESLAELYRRTGDYAAADEVLQKALAGGADSERLRFKRADTLVDAGELAAAEEVAKDFQEGAFRDLIRGRILLLRGDPAGALEALEAGLTRWPDNAPARAAAGRAAQELGDYPRAFDHYRQAMRADSGATDAALAAALLARALGRPQEAVDYLRHQILNRPVSDPRIFVLAIETARAAGDQAQADSFRTELEKKAEAGNGVALAALAERARRNTGPKAALKVLDVVKIDLDDPKNEPALRARADALVQLGQAAQALAAVDRALAAHPDEPALLDLRARVLGALGRNDEARASLEKALAQDEGYAPALAGLGALAVTAGDLPGALARFDAAVAADPTDADSAYRAAQIVLAQGDRPQAEQRLRALVARSPGHVAACNDLAWILAENGSDLDFALALAERAVRLAPQPSPDLADTLAFVQLARGDAQGAVATLEPALEAHPDSGVLRYRLGLAREKLGDEQAALAAYRAALADPGFPQAEQARAQIARLEESAAR